MKAGSRLRSAVCDTEVMVVAAPAAEVELSCGGAAMLEIAAARSGDGAPAPDAAEGTQLGKRYVNEAGDLEILCTKPGQGSLGVAGALLTVKEAKPLPASD
ncbi:MAG: hypothetical protein J4G09_09780 [Proteobacteria bacterium]|nr:hypothetical protein [Pseudomonadota bacterium]